MSAFDVSRAQLSDQDMFQPFEVLATQSLGEAIATGEVREDKPVLAIVREAGALVLLAQQMTYHHVAQGDLAGEPWLVSF
jgi:hypothetical protein